MKKFRKTAAFLLTAVLAAGLLAGCGDKPGSGGGSTERQSQAADVEVPEVKALTVEEIMAQTAENLEKLESYAVNADMEIAMSIDLSDYGMDPMSMSLQMNIFAETTKDPEVSHATMSMDVKSQDETTSNQAESYSFKENNVLKTFTRQATGGEYGDWTELENSGVNAETMLGKDIYTQAAEGTIDAVLDETTTTYNGKNVYAVQVTVSGDQISGMIGSGLSSLNLSKEALEGLSYEMTLYIDRETLLPVAAYFDLMEMMSSAMGASMESSMMELVSFDTCEMTMEYSGFDVISDIVLPDFTATAEPGSTETGTSSSGVDPIIDSEGRYIIHAYDDFYVACPFPEGSKVDYVSEYEVTGVYEIDSYAHDISIDYYFLGDTHIDEYDELCDAAYVRENPDQYVNVEQSEKKSLTFGQYELVYSRVAYDSVVKDDDGNEIEPNHYVEYEGWVEKDGVVFVIIYDECRFYDTQKTALPDDEAFLIFIYELTVY